MKTAATFSDKVDFALYFTIGVSVILLIAITFFMVRFVIKYHRSKNPVATQQDGNVKLEIIWTVVPTILVLIMFYVGYIGYTPLRDFPENAMKVKVTGRMWSWTFEYENGAAYDTLKVPVNTPVVLEMSSQDVVHSLYIPAFRVKEDVNPGRTNKMWFNATMIDTFDIFCAEYCGLLHSSMITKLVVLPQSEFDSWLAANAPAAGGVDPVLDAARFVKAKGCVACHSTDGSRLVGSSFAGLFGSTKTVLVDGKPQQITVDEAYIRESVLKPNDKVVEGFASGLMPSYEGQLTEEELAKIVLYIQSLK
ncbi:MAG: cytochrome c oxidase subunit II [Bacteroidales bacterium]|nr:cytochrome c oxidase subunit II [Bacteroidales bacterium]